MLDRLKREVWKWLHVLAAMLITAICFWATFTHACVDGWWLIYIGGVAFATGFYIFKRY